MSLVETLPGETSPICVFKTTAGDTISVPRPSLDDAQEQSVTEALRDILADEDLF